MLKTVLKSSLLLGSLLAGLQEGHACNHSLDGEIIALIRDKLNEGNPAAQVAVFQTEEEAAANLPENLRSVEKREALVRMAKECPLYVEFSVEKLLALIDKKALEYLLFREDGRVEKLLAAYLRNPSGRLKRNDGLANELTKKSAKGGHGWSLKEILEDMKERYVDDPKLRSEIQGRYEKRNPGAVYPFSTHEEIESFIQVGLEDSMRNNRGGWKEILGQKVKYIMDGELGYTGGCKGAVEFIDSFLSSPGVDKREGVQKWAFDKKYEVLWREFFESGPKREKGLLSFLHREAVAGNVRALRLIAIDFKGFSKQEFSKKDQDLDVLKDYNPQQIIEQYAAQGHGWALKDKICGHMMGWYGFKKDAAEATRILDEHVASGKWWAVNFKIEYLSIKGKTYNCAPEFWYTMYTHTEVRNLLKAKKYEALHKGKLTYDLTKDQMAEEISRLLDLQVAAGNVKAIRDKFIFMYSGIFGYKENPAAANKFVEDLYGLSN